jgi:ABC-type phosphate transport system substrate-binding protein
MAVIVLIITNLMGYAYALEGLSGPAFSDPSQVMDMPESWKKKSVKHDLGKEGADLVISLDQQGYPVFYPIINNYAKKHGLKIVVEMGTCGISSGMLSKKTIDIGGFCCAPGMTDRLPGLRFHTVGIASIALIVHPENPVNNISIEEARQIFMGELYRWSELNTKGKNLPIQPIGRLHCKLRPGHWRLLLDNEDLFSPGLTEVGAIPDMITRVSDNTMSIGYETMWVTRMLNQHGNVKSLKIDGHDPKDLSGLESGKYPLYRVYTLTTWEGEGVENQEAQKLVDFLLEQADHLGDKMDIVSSSRLREAGWKFKGDELVGEPE